MDYRTRKLLSLRNGRTDWYKISNRGSGLTEVMIYDEIGYFGVTAQDFMNDLATIKGDISLRINCPGGDVFDSIAIYNALRNRDGSVGVTVDGLAASSASFIAQAASPGQLVMARTASMMIHDAFGMGVGNAADMRELAGLLDHQSDNIASIYAERSGQPVSQWREAMRAESWYVGPEAVSAGLADRVLDVKATENKWDLSVFSHAPKITDASVDESAWDASKAWAAGAASDDPAAFYNGICAGKKAGDPSTQAAHALPHHYHPGDAPNAAGVRNALARFSSTEGLTNEAAAKAHLESHMKAIGGNSDADDNASNSYDVDQLVAAMRGAFQ